MPICGCLRAAISLCLSILVSANFTIPDRFPSGNVLFLPSTPSAPSFVLSNSSASLVNVSFSFAAWVRRLGVSDSPDCVFTHGILQPNQGFRACYRPIQEGCRFAISFNGDSLLTDPFPADNGMWVHWTITYNATASGGQGNRVVYRNGRAIAFDVASNDYMGEGPIIIGGGYWPDVNGSHLAVDDVRVYAGRALQNYEVYDIFSNTKPHWGRLYLWYVFDDAVGSPIVQDMSQRTLPNGSIWQGQAGILMGAAEIHMLCAPELNEEAGNSCATRPCNPGSTPSPFGGGNCTVCPRGTFQSAYANTNCTPCPPNLYTASNGSTTAAACQVYRQYTIYDAPSTPSFGPCEVDNLRWAEVIARQQGPNITSWTGGMGSLFSNETKVWVCLNQTYTAIECPSPPDLACFVYGEVSRAFAYWGANSYLRLVPP